MIYFDGSEGMRSRFGIDTMRWAIFKRLHVPETERSEGQPLADSLAAGGVGPSRVGHEAVPRRAHPAGITIPAHDLLEPQLGWWAPRGPSAIARGHFPDELEVFRRPEPGHRRPLGRSRGCMRSTGRRNARIEELFTVLGWYERLRLARYFDQTTLQQVGQPGHDVRLRQNAAGQWQAHRRIWPNIASARWATARSSGRLRTRTPPNRSCAAGSPHRRSRLMMTPKPRCWPISPISMRWTTAATRPGSPPASNWRLRTSKPVVEPAAPRRPTPARVLAAAQIGRTDKHPYFSMLPGDALGLWVKGDGSCALLNVQIRSPREYQECISDHYIDLDFVGCGATWRSCSASAIRSGLRITRGLMAVAEATPSTETRWTGRISPRSTCC